MYIIAWVDQNLSRWFLNEFIDLACITEFGRLFHYRTFHALFYRLLSCLLLAFGMLMPQ